MPSATPLSQFDMHRLGAALPQLQIEYRRTLTSTNDRALELAARQNLALPWLVLADNQTAGRGRRDNRWWSATGALTFSLVLDAQAALPSAEQWPQLALVAGLSLCELVEFRWPGLVCGLKWPNDVLLDSRKLAGVLVEVAHRTPRPRSRLVLGMGINLNNSLAGAPPEIQRRGVSLHDLTATPVDPTGFLVDLLQRLQGNLGRLVAHDAALAEAWQARCVMRGCFVQVNQGSRLIAGTCHGIDATGALVVETETGRCRLSGGVLEFPIAGPDAARREGEESPRIERISS